MPEFVVNSAHRLDPYRNFKFRVRFGTGTDYVAGVSKISALTRTTEVSSHRSGGDFSSSRKAPGRTEYAAVTLERGVTFDAEFERWANKVWNYKNAQAGATDRTKEVSLADFRKDITIVVFNEAGQPVVGYLLYRCWVSEFQAMGELDANANAVLIQHLKIENEGWVRDTSIVETEEPSFTDPVA
ncbi:phage tail protein [Actinoplanes sp. CA-030573]|uniref:phage tail protein n=1 Tax=Actinoplanes sp. CA-030573 TaxID=3239898 RepID=UPI003D93C88D